MCSNQENLFQCPCNLVPTLQMLHCLLLHHLSTCNCTSTSTCTSSFTCSFTYHSYSIHNYDEGPSISRSSHSILQHELSLSISPAIQVHLLRHLLASTSSALLRLLWSNSLNILHHPHFPLFPLPSYFWSEMPTLRWMHSSGPTSCGSRSKPQWSPLRRHA